MDIDYCIAGLVLAVIVEFVVGAVLIYRTWREPLKIGAQPIVEPVKVYTEADGTQRARYFCHTL